MKLLHVLSESDTDAFFYERIAERVTSRSFVRCDIRLRRGCGHAQVMASIKLLLSKFPAGSPRPDSAILLTVDNDRCPDHPGASAHPKPLSSAERRRQSRWLTVRQVMEARWGSFRGNWPVDVAVAIPVEMIESWVLLLLDPGRGPLPIYSRQTDSMAVAFHHPEKPGRQLKDLLIDEARARGCLVRDLIIDAAESDLQLVKDASTSFRMFVEELESWRS